MEDSFDVKGRGLLFVGIWNEKIADFKNDAKVKILRPDGEEIFSNIEFIDCEINRQTRKKYLILTFDKKFTKQDIPIGSEVYLV